MESVRFTPGEPSESAPLVCSCGQYSGIVAGWKEHRRASGCPKVQIQMLQKPIPSAFDPDGPRLVLPRTGRG